MQRIVYGSVVVLLSGITGNALAQEPTPVDWSGFYVGGLLGAAKGKSETHTHAGADVIYFLPDETVQLSEAGSNELEQWQPAGGLLGGYGKQFGNLYVGVEVSVSSLFLDDQHSVTETYVSTPGTNLTLKQSVSADWIATLRPRLGWAQDNWLVYVTGGLAVTQLRLDTKFTDDAWSAYSRSTTKETVTGVSLGLGGEYALGPNWAIKGEYLYTKFDEVESSSYLSTTNAGGGRLHHSADLDTQGLFIGATYRFH